MNTLLSILTRRWMPGILAVLFVLPAAFSLFGTQVATAQACIVRTDWPVYTVVRGDTLNKIAQRSGTTAGVLASANCLPNINTIYAGQQLRVPSAPVVLTPTPVPSNSAVYNVRVSFQWFQRGFMLWRADNGEISVYVGQESGATLSYPSYTYGMLPDNRVITPTGYTSPIFGIGKVWGNFANVRNSIGWASVPEVAYVATVTRTGNTFFFNLPDGRIVYVDANRRWVTNGTTPIPYPTTVPATTVPPTPTGPIITNTYGSYQPFDNGFMIWEGNTSNIVVFYGNGNYTVFTANRYGRLPDNPITLYPPEGRYYPTLGIGKVWGNFQEVRSGLGWATSGEQGMPSLTFVSSQYANQSVTSFVRPDGVTITYVRKSDGTQYWTPR